MGKLTQISVKRQNELYVKLMAEAIELKTKGNLQNNTYLSAVHQTHHRVSGTLLEKLTPFKTTHTGKKRELITDDKFTDSFTTMQCKLEEG